MGAAPIPGILATSHTGLAYPQQAQLAKQGAGVMNDILEDLKSWLAQLIEDAPHRKGGLPEIEIAYVNRAITEIERLRAMACGNSGSGC
jgi:hypothetical protein